MLGGEPGVRRELMRFQVETGTRVCTSLEDLGRGLVRLRRLVADAAARLGCRLVASGTAPFVPGTRAGRVTDQPRYQELAQHYGPLMIKAGGTCGCHVHVGAPSRDLGVQVLARLRPWLASLLAITVNSPIAGGHDTAWASWRYPLWSRWPTAAPPAVWPDAAAYDATIRGLIDQGAALDEQGVYLFARLSSRYPTVEVRVADVCLDAGTAVLLAGLARALVATALAEARRGSAGGSGTGPVGRCGLDRCGTAWARRSRARPVHRADRRCAQPPVPPPLSCPRRTQRPRRHETITRLVHRLDNQGPAPSASESSSPAPHPRPRSSRRSPAQPCPGLRPTAATRGRLPGRPPGHLDAGARPEPFPRAGAVVRRCCAPTALCTGVGQCPLTLNAATWHNRQTSTRFPDLETSSHAPQKARSRAYRIARGLPLRVGHTF